MFLQLSSFGINPLTLIFLPSRRGGGASGVHSPLQAAAKVVHMQGSPSAPGLSLCFALYPRLSKCHCPVSQLHQYLLSYC